MLSAIFVTSGIEGLRHPGVMAEMAEPQASTMAGKLGLPTDPDLLVKINSGVHVGAGILLSMGKFRRLASLALLGTLVPTTWAAHRFWEVDDPGARAQQQSHFFKNLSLMGGLILSAVDNEGVPSLGRRARRRALGAGTGMAVGTKAGSAKGRATAKSTKAAARADRATARAEKGKEVAAAKAAKAAAKGRAGALAVGAAAGAKATKMAAKGIAAKKAGKAVASSAGTLFSGTNGTGEAIRAGARRAGGVLAGTVDHLPVG